jgi:hypothetical protein
LTLLESVDYLSQVNTDYAEGLDAKYEINFLKWFDFDVRCVGDAETEPEFFLKKRFFGLIGDTLKSYAATHQNIHATEDSEYSKFENPKLFHHYGVICYYDEDKNPIGIWWPEQNRLVRPGDEDYPAACFVFRSTLLAVATIQDHLMMTHWIIANAGTVNSAVHLNPFHPIRRLLKPHTYGTTAVNSRSVIILAPVRGLAYRGFGFNKNGFGNMIEHCLANFHFESLEEHFQKSGLPEKDRKDIPFYQDGLSLWNVIQSYVSTYVRIFYKDDEALLGDDEMKAYWSGYETYFGGIPVNQQTYHSPSRSNDGNDADVPPNMAKGVYNVGTLTIDNLIKQLTHHIFWVTGGHQYIGFIVEYLSDNGALPPKVYQNHYETDVQSFFQGLSLITLTAGNMPRLVDDWTHIWNTPYYRTKPEVYSQVMRNLDRFQLNLQELADEIERRNVHRAFPFDSFNPRILECSVSV